MARMKSLQTDSLPVRESPGEKETHPVGTYCRRDEKLPLAQPRVSRPNRIHRMDTGRSLAPLRVCRASHKD